MLNSMIRYLYKNVKNTKLEELKANRSGTWLYVEDPTADEIEHLVKEFGLDRGLVEDALDEDEVPRFESEYTHNYIFTRFVQQDDSLQINTVPLLVALGQNHIITISRNRLPRLEHFISGKIFANTTQRTKLFLQILNTIIDDYDAHLAAIVRQIKTTRNRLRVEEISNKDFINFVTVEDVLDDFLSSLSPTNSILRRLLTRKYVKLYEDDEDLVEDLLLNNEQSIEACRTSLKTIVNIREAYSTIMSNNLNRVIRQLTVLTVILTIPTIIGGIYGMNVALPFDHHPQAFWIVLAIITGISVALLVYFRKQRWF